MRLLLIDDLLFEPLPAGSVIFVEFDAASQWYAASFAIAAGWLKAGGSVLYTAAGQSPDRLRDQLKLFGLNVERL